MDIVVDSHHVWGWNQEAVAWLERHFRMLASQKVTLEDYAAELGIDIKSFKEILYSLHINATIQTARNPLIEKAVEEYKAQEKLNADIENHPLVKDKNFFKLTYFPSTTPSCFEDIDEDIV